jgi:two-component system cell cycle response regulator DivK
MTKILIVEDNEDNRDMLVRRLQRRGYETLSAVDGQQGIEIARNEKPDLILMDMSLPVLDGWQATRILKQDGDTRLIPIIGLSANAMAGDREKGLAVGCDEYDTKPIEMPPLLEKIQIVLAKMKGSAANTPVLPGKS